MDFFKTAKKGIRIVLDIFILLYGVFYYVIFGKTREKAHLALIRFHCLSGGRTTDFFSWILGRFSKKINLDLFELNNVFLPEKTENEINHIVEKINHEGFYLFDEKCPEEIVDHLHHFALSQPCQIQVDGLNNANSMIFDPKNPKASRYIVPMDATLDDDVIQSMLVDKTLLKIAAKYLRSLPILDICQLWLSPAWSKEPSIEAAQKYHFDMDRIKWIKLFIYLVDVDENNGPHVFVKNTHRYDKRQNHLLKGGYVRLEDSEVESVFENQVIRVTGKRGTIFLADTRAFHKGLLPNLGYRGILQLEFTSSLFGSTYPSIDNVQVNNKELLKLLKIYPDMFPIVKSVRT